MNFEITVKGHEMKVNGMTPSSNGQLVLSVSKDGKLQIRRSNDMVSVVITSNMQNIDRSARWPVGLEA